MLYVKKHCRKLKLDWGPQLSRILKRMKAWSVLKRQCQGSRYLHRLLQSSQTEIPEPLTVAAFSKQEKACWKYYRKVKKSADMIR